MCLGTLCDGGAPAAMAYEGGQRNCDLDRDHRGVHTDVPTYTCSYRRTGSAQFMPGTWNPGTLRGRADVPKLLALAVWLKAAGAAARRGSFICAEPQIKIGL